MRDGELLPADDESVAFLDRMEPWPFGRGVRLLAESGRRLRICRGLPGLGPVEPHREVADHVRLYDDGNGRAGRSRALNPAGGGARRRAARGAVAALGRGGGRAAAWPLAV